MRTVALLLHGLGMLPATVVCMVVGHSWVHVARGLPLMQCARCERICDGQPPELAGPEPTDAAPAA